MKNTYKLLSIIAIVAIIALSMASCEVDPGDDGVPKTLIITGINAESGAITVGVLHDKDVTSKTDLKIVAYNQVEYAQRVEIPLTSNQTSVQFTGSGPFYILLVFDGPTTSDSDDAVYYYTNGGLTPLPFDITKGVAEHTIPFSKFKKIQQ